METDWLFGALALGLGATALMDAWNLLLKRAFGLPSLNYCMLGRWLRHMPARFRHQNIARATERPGECVAGWIAHYSIGLGLALGFVLISGRWLEQPTLLPALGYGLATIVFPFFVLQPAIGLGVASSKAASPKQARLKSLATHTVFGIGLYLVALLLTAR